jgi:hypothetical protein
MEVNLIPNETHPFWQCKCASFGGQRASPVDTPGGRRKESLASCPLKYTGNRGSGAVKVFGRFSEACSVDTERYAYMNAVRGDGVNPRLLSIDGTVSEDVVREAMMCINKTQGLEWLNQQVVS